MSLWGHFTVEPRQLWYCFRSFTLTVAIRSGVVTSPNIWQSDWPQSVSARQSWDLAMSHSCLSISKTKTVNMVGAQTGQLTPFPSSSVLNCLSGNIRDYGFSYFPPLSYYSATHKQKSLDTYRQKGASLYLGEGIFDWDVGTVRPWVRGFHQRYVLARSHTEGWLRWEESPAEREGAWRTCVGQENKVASRNEASVSQRVVGC